jgi:uncharacterized protein (TIGR03435 family)
MTRLGLLLIVIAGTLPLAAQPSTPAFDVASIKRNTGLMPRTSGKIQDTPKGEIRLVWIPARLLVLLAYPLAREVVGLPSWATSERYDVTVKGPTDATREQVTQMWQTLLADRMKLTAHYEPRDGGGYKLVLARSDGKLGRELKPSTLDCVSPDSKSLGPPPQALRDAGRRGRVEGAVSAETERVLMSHCNTTTRVGNTTYAGGININGLVGTLRFDGMIREPVEDQTGLEGLYSFKLTFSDQPLDANTDNVPSIFTALQEQLGLKLERTSVRSPAVVVDQIERPTPN